MNTQIVPDAATCPATRRNGIPPGELALSLSVYQLYSLWSAFHPLFAPCLYDPFTVMAAFPCVRPVISTVTRSIVASTPAGGLPEYLSRMGKSLLNMQNKERHWATIAQLKNGQHCAIKLDFIACDARNGNAVATLPGRIARRNRWRIYVASGRRFTRRCAPVSTPAAPIVAVELKKRS